MNRVIADANVLVSAALARSPLAPSALVLEAALDGRLELLSSPTLLSEITSVLIRPRLRRYLSLEEAKRFVADLAAQTTQINDAPFRIRRSAATRGTTTSSHSRSPPRAGAIVTGDRDLLELRDPPVAVLTPRTLIERFDAPA